MTEHISSKVNSGLLKMVGKIYFNKREKKDNGACILCYHSISGDCPPYSVSPSRFDEQINKILKLTEIKPLGDLLQSVKKDKPRGVAITFDDGYEDIYKYAFPILRKHNLTACVFVIGDSDNVNREELENNKKLLSYKQIQELKNSGWEIGFHTATHSDIGIANDNFLFNEIIKGKDELEKKLGIKLKYFAYPKGICSKRIIRYVKKAGFTAAFICSGGGVSKKQLPFKIDRVMMNSYLKSEDLNFILTKMGLLYDKFYTQTLKFKDELFSLSLSRYSPF